MPPRPGSPASPSLDFPASKDGFPPSLDGGTPGRTSIKLSLRQNRLLRTARGYPVQLAVLGILSLLWLVSRRYAAPPSPYLSYSGPSPVRTSPAEPYHDLSNLPILSYPNGTRYPHPLPPNWPDPWPHKPQIAADWLSAERFPPSRNVEAAEVPSRQNLAQGSRDRQGTRDPPPAFELPDEYVAFADEVWGSARAGWEEQVLNRGEGFDLTGRPTKVPREVMYDGKAKGWKSRPMGEPASLPLVQKHSSDTRTKEEREVDERRREWVRRAFLHLWEAYKEIAWGSDEVKPLSGGSTNKFSGWGASLFDALDTLLVMDLKHEYLLARQHIAQVDFAYLTPPDPTAYPPPSSSALPPLSSLRRSLPAESVPDHLLSPVGVPTFETVIRYLGSLLSVYDMTNDPLMLARAKDLGDWLITSMATESGLLVGTYRFGAHSDGGPTEKVCLAEVGSTGLEFAKLSMVTGDPAYWEAAQRSLDTLDNWPTSDRIPGLFPTLIDPEQPGTLYGRYTFGGQADSYYEYLIKLHQLLGGSPASAQYSRMYVAAIEAAKKHLIRSINVVPGLENAVTIGDVHFKEVHGIQAHKMQSKSWYSMRLDHLTCFAGGMLGLGARLLKRGGDFTLAQQFTQACVWAYEATRTGLAPEIIELWNENDPNRWEVASLPDGTTTRSVRGDPIGVYESLNYHIQRPETIESVFYMYRLTGDRRWQDKAWRMFTSWVDQTIIEDGFADVDDVNSPEPKHLDSGVESFVYGETLKYYYLCFSSPELLSLDDWVFSTEAHPLRLRKPSPAHVNDAPFWKDGPPLKMPPEREIGRGTPVQKWARFVQAAAMRGWRWEEQAPAKH
ncbi:hypothetical protein JCM21900_005615 [Sporobolomyces salmonicolor]